MHSKFPYSRRVTGAVSGPEAWSCSVTGFLSLTISGVLILDLAMVIESWCFLFLAFSRVLWISRWREAESHRCFYQVCERFSLHLLHHFSAVSLDRGFADPELQTDLLI